MDGRIEQRVQGLFDRVRIGADACPNPRKRNLQTRHHDRDRCCRLLRRREFAPFGTTDRRALPIVLRERGAVGTIVRWLLIRNVRATHRIVPRHVRGPKGRDPNSLPVLGPRRHRHPALASDRIPRDRQSEARVP